MTQYPTYSTMPMAYSAMPMSYDPSVMQTMVDPEERRMPSILGICTGLYLMSVVTLRGCPKTNV